ncbi:hypothetical protein ACJQWK_04170 [Exserohilum turcicum]
MVQNLVRNDGVSALAYSINDASVLWPCSLKILYSDAQFVVSLGHSISSHGIDDKQLITFRYEGDNLMPGKTSLENVAVSLPDGSLDSIARHGQPRPRTLSLMLKAPCSVWYPHSFGNRVSSLPTGFHELLTLARATEVRIVFDINWLGKNNLARLQSAVKGSRQLTGVPVIPQFARLYQKADWSILNSILDVKSEAHLPTEDLTSEAVPSIEDAVAEAPPFEDALHDAPPSYAHVSGKRPRDARTSLTPDSPLPKRLLQDHTQASSPTERAKSIASSTSTVQVDVFQDIVTSAVKKALPDLLRAQLPSLVQELLPGMLAGSSPSPSSSPRSHSSQTASARPQHDRAPNYKPTPAAVMRAAISTCTETHLQRLLTDTLNEASNQTSELHNSASVEFEDYLADTRLEFAALKEDHMAAFDDNCNEKLAEFRERLLEEKEETHMEVKAHADEVVLKAWDRLNMVRCRCKCLCGPRDRQRNVERGRRAMSLPL